MLAIVTDVHYRMSLALIRDLGQAGVEVVTCEKETCRDNRSTPALGALSRWASRHVWLPAQGYLDALYDLCRRMGEEKGCKPALLPVGAATLAALAADRARFDAVCGLCIPTADQLDLFNSKERVAELASSLRVPVPQSFVRAAGESAEAFVRRLPLPVVVKPVCGEKLGLTAADRYVVARTAAQAGTAFRHFRALAGEDPIVQECLTGDGLGCSVLAQAGEVRAAICHRRVREYPVSGGPSSCCRREDHPDLEAMAQAMVRAAGYTGLAMFEFKEDAAGQPRLLEVNPRIWGTFPLTRVSRSGIPLLWCTLAWNAGNPAQAVPLPPQQQPRRCKMVFAASDLMAAVGYAKHGRPGRALGAAADLVNPFVRDGLFEWGDRAPAMAYYRSLFGRGK